MRFFSLPKIILFFVSIFFEKIAKIKDFGSPDPCQNPFKMPSKSMSQKTCDFPLIFADFWLLVARPEPQISCAHAVFCGLFTEIKCSLLAYVFNPKNLSKNIPKRSPNPSKIDAKNVLFFQHRFFRVSASILGVLGFQVRRAAGSARRVKAH